jgi:hypothetical protein
MPTHILSDLLEFNKLKGVVVVIEQVSSCQRGNLDDDFWNKMTTCYDLMMTHRVISYYPVTTCRIVSYDPVTTSRVVSYDPVMTHLSSVKELTDDSDDPTDNK